MKYFKDRLIDDDNHIVMHEWEHPIMKKHAEVVCQNGGDILELGFGMGISADYIQSHDIKSHTIIEKDKKVYEKLLEWSKDKPNVKTIFGNWSNNLPKEKYDGVFFDTFKDKDFRLLPLRILNVCRENTIVSWFNVWCEPDNVFSKGFLKYSDVNYYDVSITIPDFVEYLPKNNKGKYYVTEWIVGKNDTRERFIKILQGVNNGD